MKQIDNNLSNEELEKILDNNNLKEVYKVNVIDKINNEFNLNEYIELYYNVIRNEV